MSEADMQEAKEGVHRRGAMRLGQMDSTGDGLMVQVFSNAGIKLINRAHLV